VDTAEYCRQIESYLCQKNGGHLIRIVGPAFERVCSWSEQGIPIKIACRGIDRYCERQQAMPGRRRPVRIEFCEADILTIFDDWRRAIGVVREAGPGESSEYVGDAAGKATPSRQPSLVSHLERVVARLIGRREPGSARFERHVVALLADLDRLSAEARHARGEARAAILDRLAALDDDLIAIAHAEMDERSAGQIRREAEQELTAFGQRLPADARAKAIDAIVTRLVRESRALPTLRYG
jgi:hypothetical protein